MKSRDIFENINPFDHRYSYNKEIFTELKEYLSEKANIKYQLEVELALIKGLKILGVCSEEIYNEVREAISTITAEEAYIEEQKTKHNIRALVNLIQKKVSKKAKPYIHLTATSYDVVDTANTLRYKDVTKDVILVKLKEVIKQLSKLAEQEKDTIQIGRTHGQHAVPITFGYVLAGYVERLGLRYKEIEKKAELLKGKFSGACGTYNASSLFFDDPVEFENIIMDELGLKAGNFSSQIVIAEYMTDYIHSLISTFGVLANFSDDMRNLQRTEINEVGEYFSRDQIGSSTMPHKRNPINYENIKSMWKRTMPQMNTIYMDQISEHQRDLSNSASSRFIPDIITGFTISLQRLIKVLNKFGIDRQKMEDNFALHSQMIIAEPLYIILASQGHPDAHEAVRKLTLEAEGSEKTPRELFYLKDEFSQYRKKMDDYQKMILENPKKYLGVAKERSQFIINKWNKYFLEER
ncbi:MAG: adenylosuccinate lyase [Halanaerobiales bacterium]|nr:adenylosuccinate lyase [Halanaerobiales bacterium]